MTTMLAYQLPLAGPFASVPPAPLFLSWNPHYPKCRPLPPKFSERETQNATIFRCRCPALRSRGIGSPKEIASRVGTSALTRLSLKRTERSTDNGRGSWTGVFYCFDSSLGSWLLSDVEDRGLDLVITVAGAGVSCTDVSVFLVRLRAEAHRVSDHLHLFDVFLPFWDSGCSDAEERRASSWIG